MSVLATALAFASRRHAVLPLWWPVGPDTNLVCACGRNPCGTNNRNAAKHPHKIARNGFKSATIEIGVAKHWFAFLLPNANVGICTDYLLVIDIDPRHGGDESSAALVKERGELPPTWRALTGGGGEHVLFAAPDGVEVTSFSAENMKDPPLGKGVDIRARGGYIVGVGSRHITGRHYEWSVDHHPNDVPLAPAPTWLVERLTARTATAAADGEHEPLPPAEWLKRLKPASEYPDDAALAIVGHLFARGCDSRVILGLMQPWARESGLDQQELEKIFDRIARKEAAKRRRRLEQ